MVHLHHATRKVIKVNNYQYYYIMYFFQIYNCIYRALNEMWKCQNMLRSHVRELLDLHKQPSVSLRFVYKCLIIVIIQFFYSYPS